MNSIIIYDGISLRRRDINAAINRYYKQQDEDGLKAGKIMKVGVRRASQHQLVLDFCFKVIEPQLQQLKFRLDLSDTTVSQALDISIHQAKRIRLLAKEMGLIFFPEWSRPKKKGHYPLWLMRFDYFTIPWDKRTKREIKNPMYVPFFYELRSEAYALVAEELRQDGVQVPTKTFMKASYEKLDELLLREGLTKEELLKPKESKKRGRTRKDDSTTDSPE